MTEYHRQDGGCRRNPPSLYLSVGNSRSNFFSPPSQYFLGNRPEYILFVLLFKSLLNAPLGWSHLPCGKRHTPPTSKHCAPFLRFQVLTAVLLCKFCVARLYPTVHIWHLHQIPLRKGNTSTSVPGSSFQYHCRWRRCTNGNLSPEGLLLAIKTITRHQRLKTLYIGDSTVRCCHTQKLQVWLFRCNPLE